MSQLCYYPNDDPVATARGSEFVKQHEAHHFLSPLQGEEVVLS